VRAVNLIPADLRKERGRVSRTGAGPYVLIAALTTVVVLVSAWAITVRQASDREVQLTQVTQEAEQAEQRAITLKPYADFAQMRENRVQTIRDLSRSRFNWSYALREVSRIMPSDVWLTELIGTVSPAVQVEGGGANPLRANVDAPAIDVTGCTTDQSNVARFIARLRDVEGVTRVSLSSSEKAEGSGGGGVSAGGGGGGDCRQGNDRFAQFKLVAFFEKSEAIGTTATPQDAAATPTTPASQEQAK
jgi:Tfp pilus assembly protein PilN